MFAVIGLTLALVFESLSIKKTLWYLLLICLGLLFILKIHAVEFLYYALYLGVIPVIFIDKIAKFCRKHPFYAVFSIVGIVSLLTVLVPIIKKIPYKEPELLRYLSLEKLPALFQKIESDGHIVVSYYNKFFTTMNEIISLSSLLLFCMFFVLIYRVYMKKERLVKPRAFIFVFISSLFIYIPVMQFTAGVASLLTYPRLAYRFYFTSLLFVVIPMVLFYFLSLWHQRKLYCSCFAIDILLLQIQHVIQP